MVINASLRNRSFYMANENRHSFLLFPSKGALLRRHNAAVFSYHILPGRAHQTNIKPKLKTGKKAGSADMHFGPGRNSHKPEQVDVSLHSWRNTHHGFE